MAPWYFDHAWRQVVRNIRQGRGDELEYSVGTDVAAVADFLYEQSARCREMRRVMPLTLHQKLALASAERAYLTEALAVVREGLSGLPRRD